MCVIFLETIQGDVKTGGLHDSLSSADYHECIDSDKKKRARLAHFYLIYNIMR